MINKLHFSTIFFLILFLSFKGFSKNLVDGQWNTPVSSELAWVSLINFPDEDLHHEASKYYNETSNQFKNISAADDEAFLAPCTTIGDPCNDGNPNTVNDKVDADCECRGVAVSLSCEDVEISYEINNGLRDSGAAAITVSETDSIELFANLEGVTITGPNGIVPNNTINNITSAGAGVYTVNGSYKVTRPTTLPILKYVSSEETVDETAPASNALDGNNNTFWHTQYSNDPDTPYPHEIHLDMGEGSLLSGFTYLPRQNSSNGRIGTYDIYVSNSTSPTGWGTPVVNNGTFANSATLKTVSFPATQGRYLRFVAKTPITSGQAWATAAEIGVIRARPTSTASSEETAPPGNPASYAVDGDNTTFWHTKYTRGFAQAPHFITLDLLEDSNVSGLEYLPRQDGVTNGRILSYQIFVSNSPTVWPATPIITGAFEYSGTATNQSRLRTVPFAETRGRYVRLVATSAQSGTNGNGGDLASAAEVRAVRTINVTCSKTITINVDPIDTYTFNDGTWFPRDPSGFATKNDIIYIASGDAIFSGSIRCGALTVFPGASLTINTDAILTCNTTTLRSESNKFSSLIVNGEIIGVVNYERYVNIMGTSDGGGNDLISPPLKDGTFNNAFVTTNSNLPENQDPNKKGEFAFAPFNIDNDAYENFNIGADHSGSIPLVSGKGYRVATKIGSTLTFTGTAVPLDVDIAISDASKGRAWNLIGNPYPSYLDFEMFFATNASEFDSRDAYQAIYGYTGASSTWTTWNQATIEDGEIITSITPGQGFFVKAKAGGGSVKFTPAMRITGNSDDFILGRQNKNIALSKLKLNSATQNGVTSIYFIDGTTKGLDSGYDAASYAATTVDFSIFTNLVEDNTGLEIAIQSLPYDDFNAVTVPLGIKAKAGATLTISIDDLSTIPSNINVYLEDIENNTLTLLNTGAYAFKLNADLNSADRFNVHYSAKTLSVADMESHNNLRIYTTVTPKTLFINGLLSRGTSANLYDIQGRLVMTKVLNTNSTQNTMDISTVKTGVYVVKINSDNQFKTQKVIIK